MPELPLRSAAVLGLCLIAAAPRPAQALHFRNAEVKALSFADLDGWQSDNLAVAFKTFMKSCDAILQATKAMRKARLFYAGLYNACEKGTTLAADKIDTVKARKFFEKNFKPVRILPAVHTYGFYTGADGFYTGYYEPEVTGSRVKTKEFNIPLYRVPAKIAGKRSKVFAQYDRKDIENGALTGKGLEICWIKDPIDAFFAQIQGSTRIKLDNGELLRLNYIASNGKPYTPVGRLMIEQGLCTPEEMSMDRIREYMEANPEEGAALRLKNRSYVFFNETQLKPDDEPVGAQGIPLTPGRSLAVDPSNHVYGTPIWIDAKFPIKSPVPEDTFQHLMFAQDTGSAIRGVARADIYFGHGGDIPHIAGRIKQFGKFVMLVPKDLSVSGEKPNVTPLPVPRPREIAVQEAMASGKKKAPVVADEVAAPVSKPRP